MAKSNHPNFEIPPEMRAFAEKSVDQARKAFDTFISAAQQAADAADKHAAGTRAGIKSLGERAMVYAERNMAASFDFAQKLVRAKDSAEVLALQADYVKSQIAALNVQAKELGQEAARMAGAGTEP
jgi:phasin